jgi:hypothetical protein
MSDAQQPVLERQEKTPFWGYNDLLLFIGLAPVCLILGFALVKLPLRWLHVHPAAQVASGTVAGVSVSFRSAGSDLPAVARPAVLGVSGLDLDAPARRFNRVCGRGHGADCRGGQQPDSLTRHR